jgi:hypothetical protein
MKKIALISASVLALGAASIAADADGVSMLHTETRLAMMVSSTVVSPDTTATDHGETRMLADRAGRKQRSVRLVSSGVETDSSCETANWPYYPAECLKRVETAGL